jgi:hypothetical protein
MWTRIISSGSLRGPGAGLREYGNIPLWGGGVLQKARNFFINRVTTNFMRRASSTQALRVIHSHTRFSLPTSTFLHDVTQAEQHFKRPIHSQLAWAILVWRHTWRKNRVNCAVLTGNRPGLRTVLSSRLSHTELRSSLREFHSFLSLPADTTMASSHGTSVSSNSFRRWASHVYSFSNITSYLALTAYFSSFQMTMWPMWLANSPRQPCHTIVTRKGTHT